MVRVRRSARNRMVVANGEKKQLDEGAGRRNIVINDSNKAAVEEVVPETDDEVLLEAGLAEVAIITEVIAESEGEDEGLAAGQVEMNADEQQQNNSINQGTTVYYKLRAALPRKFTVAHMEEIYQALCTVKHAASLASQKSLECVSDNALGWLRLAFKKIHSKDLSREACHVKETCVMKMVQVLEADHSKFPATLESLAKPCDGVTLVKKNVKGKALQGDQQPSSEDHDHDQHLHRSKRTSQAASTDQPPDKKSKTEDDSDVDDNDDDDTGANDGEEEEDVSSWKEFYKRPSNKDTLARTAYLSEYYKFVQTIDGGWVHEDEALAHTRQVHKMMEMIDSETDTIDCLLDRTKVWDWVNPRIETEFSERTLQKYLLSLEKFFRFVMWHRSLPPHLKLSEKTKGLAESLAQTCPNWRRSVHKIAAEKRWKRLLSDPVYIQQRIEEASKRFQIIQTILGRSSGSTVTSASNENNLQEGNLTAGWPRRKKWDKKDTKLLKKYFKTNPGRKAIRKKMDEFEELQELKKREGLYRCYEKLKSMFKKKKSTGQRRSSV